MDYCGNQHLFDHFVDLVLGAEIFFEKKKGNNKKGLLILKQVIEALLNTYIGAEKNFGQSLSAFLLFFLVTKNSLDLYYHPLAIEFF